MARSPTPALAPTTSRSSQTCCPRTREEAAGGAASPPCTAPRCGEHLLRSRRPRRTQRLLVPLLRPFMKSPARVPPPRSTWLPLRTRRRNQLLFCQQRPQAIHLAQLRRGTGPAPVADQRRPGRTRFVPTTMRAGGSSFASLTLIAGPALMAWPGYSTSAGSEARRPRPACRGGKTRPGFEQLLRDIESGAVDGLAARHLDPLLRRTTPIWSVFSRRYRVATAAASSPASRGVSDRPVVGLRAVAGASSAWVRRARRGSVRRRGCGQVPRPQPHDASSSASLTAVR